MVFIIYLDLLLNHCDLQFETLKSHNIIYTVQYFCMYYNYNTTTTTVLHLAIHALLLYSAIDYDVIVCV